MPSAQCAKLSYSDFGKSNGYASDLKNSSLLADRQVELQNSYMKGSPPTSAFNSGGAFPSQFHHLDKANLSLPNYGLAGYSVNPAVASMMANQLGSGRMVYLSYAFKIFCMFSSVYN
ncbi:pumilio 2 [Euphorbia peplus]|nr:pumilio 2 [Euphorbia peplus]